jgi:Bacterial capsule synthesis protein PGA_cap
MQPANKAETVALCAVGDVMPNREEPAKFFELCKEVLDAFDVRFCQLETNFSERTGRASGARVPTRAHPRNVQALTAGRFDVVTYAGDFRKTMAVKCLLSRHGIERVSFLPATITKDARPRFLSKTEDAFGELVQYMKDVTAEANLNAQYRVEGDEVVVL